MFREREIKDIRTKQNTHAFKYPLITKKVLTYEDSRCNPQCGGSKEDLFNQNNPQPHRIRQQRLIPELRRQLWSLSIDRGENIREHDYFDDGDKSDIEDEDKATIPPLLLDDFKEPMHIQTEIQESWVLS
jgi:hypothetical protein